jgi:hypothetical protein
MTIYNVQIDDDGRYRCMDVEQIDVTVRGIYSR